MEFTIVFYFILLLIGFSLAFSASWALGYFGLSCFEQIIFHLKVPLEGTNTEFIFDWFKICFAKAVVLTILLTIPNFLTSVYPQYYPSFTILLFFILF